MSRKIKTRASGGGQSHDCPEAHGNNNSNRGGLASTSAHTNNNGGSGGSDKSALIHSGGANVGVVNSALGNVGNNNHGSNSHSHSPNGHGPPVVVVGNKRRRPHSDDNNNNNNNNNNNSSSSNQQPPYTATNKERTRSYSRRPGEDKRRSYSRRCSERPPPTRGNYRKNDSINSNLGGIQGMGASGGSAFGPVDGRMPPEYAHPSYRLGKSAAATAIAAAAAPAPATQQQQQQQQYRSPPHRPDDKDGHYVYALGESLTPRYKILSRLGEGTFGRVLECWDRETRSYTAVKVIRSVRKYREAAMMEIKVLRAIAEEWRKSAPKSSENRCVEMLGWFSYRDHVCMVFEKLGLSLYDFMRRNRYQPFPVPLVRQFGIQLVEGLVFMHRHGLIHTDLKPENILLVNTDFAQHNNLLESAHQASIKLIDFGSAIFTHDHHSRVVSTRHYRAPEVILGLGWSFPCDAWSVGCILVELMQGEALFQTHEDLEHLAMMESLLGPIPGKMVKNADCKAARYFRKRVLHPSGAAAVAAPAAAAAAAAAAAMSDGSGASTGTANMALPAPLAAPAPAPAPAATTAAAPAPAAATTQTPKSHSASAPAPEIGAGDFDRPPAVVSRKPVPTTGEQVELVQYELIWPEGAQSDESLAAVARVNPLSVTLLQGQAAFAAANANDTASAGAGGSGSSGGEAGSSETEAMLSLILGLLRYDPHERLTSEEALLLLR